MEGIAMDALKQQLLRIQQQVSGLSASQKMLTTALVAIMVMTLLWWGNYAGTAETEALLDRPLTADELAEIKSELRAKNITFTVSGDRLMVPADRRLEIISDLGYARKLPRDMGNAFDEVIGKINPLADPNTTAQMLNRGREKALSQMLSGWPGVVSANVMIDRTSARRIGVKDIEPTALVSLSLKQAALEANPEIAYAAADMVVGATSNMKRSNVKVTINGKPVRIRDEADNGLGDSATQMDLRERAEEHYRQKIKMQLAHIDNVNAIVTVELNTSTKNTFVRKVDPKNKIELQKSVTTENEESSQPFGRDGYDPGAVSNTGINKNGGDGGSLATKTREKSNVENETDHGFEETKILNGPGDEKAVAAAVRVPRSFFVKSWQQSNRGGSGEPTEEQLRKMIDEELVRIRADVKGATNIADDNAISVASYDDIMPTVVPDVAQAGLSVPLAAGGISVKEIAIGVLAVASLFMVSMMVRRAAPTPVVLPKPIVRTERTNLHAGDDITGEAASGASALFAQELTPEMLESTQMVEQVATMVKENPDAAANLVKRWLNQG